MHSTRRRESTECKCAMRAGPSFTPALPSIPIPNPDPNPPFFPICFP